jgi:hypothetical protein
MTRTSAPVVPAAAISGLALKSLWLAILAKVTLLFVLALNTRFVMDEFWHFGQAKYLGNGLFDTIWPGKAVGYALFYKLAHVVGWDATSMLLAGRLQTALLGCATLFIVYALARAIGEDRLRSLLIVLLLLCFSTFIERIFRLRSEPLALFFGAAALLTMVRGEPDAWRRLLTAGVLSGLAFLSTQKSVYFNVSLGLALLTDAVAARHYLGGIRRGSLLVAGWSIPVLLYCIVFGSGNPMSVVMNLVTGPLEVATVGHTYYSNLHHFVYQTLLRNAPLYLSCALGVAIALRGFRSLPAPRRIALVFTVVIATLIFAHNQPWPYVFIMAIPFLALWGLGGYDVLSPRLSKGGRAGLLVLIVAVSLWRSFIYLEHDNREQLAVVATADGLLAEDDTYFDGSGMLPNHEDSPYIWLDAPGVRLARTEGTDSELYQGLTDAPPNLVIRSYRTEALRSVLEPFLESRYLAIAPNIMLPGRTLPLGRAVTFDAPIAGAYGIYDEMGAPIAGRIQVDGVWRDLPVRLSARTHTLLAEGGDRPLVILPAGLSLGPLAPEMMTPAPLFAGVYSF